MAIKLLLIYLNIIELYRKHLCQFLSRSKFLQIKTGVVSYHFTMIRLLHFLANCLDQEMVKKQQAAIFHSFPNQNEAPLIMLNGRNVVNANFD